MILMMKMFIQWSAKNAGPCTSIFPPIIPRLLTTPSPPVILQQTAPFTQCRRSCCPTATSVMMKRKLMVSSARLIRVMLMLLISSVRLQTQQLPETQTSPPQLGPHQVSTPNLRHRHRCQPLKLTLTQQLQMTKLSYWQRQVLTP